MNPGAILCNLPTWDWATAGYIVSSLPGETRNGLTKTAFIVLQTLLYLFGVHARRSGNQTAYATPGQSYLGSIVDRCPRTVRRALTLLVGLDLIVMQRRMPLDNRPLTNLYKIGGQLKALLFNLFGRKSAMKSHRDIFVPQRPKERSGPPKLDARGDPTQHKRRLPASPLASPAVPAGSEGGLQENLDGYYEGISEGLRERIRRQQLERDGRTNTA